MATTLSPKRKGKKPSVLKRIRQTERRTAVNRARKSRLRGQLKKFKRVLEARQLEEARAQLQPTLSLLDRMARKGILHPNTASRTKSRLVRRFQALSQQQSSAA